MNFYGNSHFFLISHSKTFSEPKSERQPRRQQDPKAAISLNEPKSAPPASPRLKYFGQSDQSEDDELVIEEEHLEQIDTSTTGTADRPDSAASDILMGNWLKKCDKDDDDVVDGGKDIEMTMKGRDF